MNKSYVYITIFFLLASFATALAPVSSYPYFFDAHNYNVKIVVGSQAPSEHVLAATDISSSIISVSHSQNVQSALAEEIDSYEQDMVVIGDPCETSTYIPSQTKSTSSSDSSTRTTSSSTSSPTTSSSAKSTFVKKDIDIATEKTIDIDCPEGCKDEEGLCYSVGEQNLVKGQRAYCKEDNLWYPLKAKGKACVDNYQCKTNYCQEKVCTTEAKDGFLKRFFTWVI